MPWWQPVVLGAAAGGMGWGIRGQYGHETGAMIAGLLVSLSLALLFARHAPSLTVARAVAWTTVAMGFGGSMTYGQTIGLTQNAVFVGNWDAWRWGMLGLTIKGGIWIGFAGLFLGLGLGRDAARLRAQEMALLMALLLGTFFLGVWALNQPFDPDRRVLPSLYFSADWRWQPEALDLKPRREVWGGLLFALATAIALAVWRKERLAVRLALWGLLGGALGFPLGQCLQSCHAWNLEFFREGWLARIDPCINWWNMMETGFGATFGAVLGFGLWRNRSEMAPADASPGVVTLAPPVEAVLLAIHLSLLVASEFFATAVGGLYTEIALLLGFIPIVAIAGGRWWPLLAALPITLVPIAGKTVSKLVYEEAAIGPAMGWILYAAVPLALATTLAIRFVSRSTASAEPSGAAAAAAYLRSTLLLATWLFFGLNFAFFRFPWPWQPWTTRTPNALIFTLCAVVLTLAALRSGQRSPRGVAAAPR